MEIWIPNPLWTHFGLIETPLVGGVVGGLNQAFAPKIRQSACGWSAKSCLRWLNGAAGTLPRLGSWVCWWHIRLAIWNASFHHFIASGTWLFLNLKRCQESGGPKSHRVWYFMFWQKRVPVYPFLIEHRFELRSKFGGKSYHTHLLQCSWHKV